MKMEDRHDLHGPDGRFAPEKDAESPETLRVTPRSSLEVTARSLHETIAEAERQIGQGADVEFWVGRIADATFNLVEASLLEGRKGMSQIRQPKAEPCDLPQPYRGQGEG